MVSSSPLESFKESVFVKDVEKRGGEAIKIYNRAGYPDRLCWLPTGSGIVWFWAEWKRKGRAPELHQIETAIRLVKQGHMVYFFDDNKEARGVMDALVMLNAN